MKEIKFRAWDKKEKRMLEVRCIDWTNQRIYFSVRQDRFGDDVVERLDFHKVIFLQFTGLLDKDGKDLDWWEGDLISKPESRVIHEIFWNEKCGEWCGRRINFISDPSGYRPLWKYRDSGSFEVIGNIYENPELLNSPCPNTS